MLLTASSIILYRRRSTVEPESRVDTQAPPDVGEDPHAQELRRKGRATLVDAGRHTGESRVVYKGHNIPLHLLTKDFFISVVQLDTYWIVAGVAFIYIVVFFIWSLIWWLVVKFQEGCLYGADSYVESLAFSVVTQMTIGYGNTGPQHCWTATWLIIIQSVLGVVLEAVVLGVVFARISHPHQRSRSIFISNKAVIARRDGILKFMFRVADIRNTQVVEPKVKAYMYTWGEGRVTAEGERIPVRVEPLDVDYIDGMLLLPLIIEHTIDERSPLCGHTHTSLNSLNAEIVVTFEGTTEMGNPFMARRSYVPQEIYWGHKFSNVVGDPLDAKDHYEVHLDNFHKVELQADMPVKHPVQLSDLVVNRAKRTIPYPLLGENTLVLSDVLCVAPNEDGQLALYCRVGDTYPNQMLEITAKILLYRWRDPDAITRHEAAPSGEPFEMSYLECGYETGTDRLHLRLPTLVTHVIDSDSPLASWREPGGVEQDVYSEIVVVINAYMNVNNSNVLRQRTYRVNHHVRFGYGFTPIVRSPHEAHDNKPRVRWQHFHETERVKGMENYPDSRAIAGISSAHLMSIAPESHASIRTLSGAYNSLSYSNVERNDMTVVPADLQRYAAAVGGDASQITGAPPPEPFMLFPNTYIEYDDSYDAGTSLPHPAALHPTLPGPDRFRQSDVTMYDNRNDYTVPAMGDLSRYNAAVGQSDSLPRQPISRFTPIPPEFRRTTATAAPDMTRRDSQPGSSQQISPSNDGETAATAAAAAGASQAASDGSPAAPAEVEEQEERRVSAPQHIEHPRVTIAELPQDQDSSFGGKSDASSSAGPLAGFRPVERTVSYATEVGDEEEAAGPMHFASAKTRQGAKSYMELTSLFTGSDGDSDVVEGEEKPPK